MHFPTVSRSHLLGAVALAGLLGGTPAAALTLTATLNDPLLQQNQFTATSELNAAGGILCAPCTVTHKIEGYAEDGDVRFDWSMGDFSFQGIVRTGMSISPTNSFTTFETVASAMGTLTLTNLGTQTPIVGSGAASYWKESPGAVIEALMDALETIGDVVELRSDIQGSPTKISFFSRVERVGANQYAYTQSVENYTDFDIDFDWSAAGLVGTVLAATAPDAPGVFTGTTTYGRNPTELRASATADLTFDNPFGGDAITDNQFVVRANVLAPAPVPVPPAVVLLGSALAGLMGARRGRRVA